MKLTVTQEQLECVLLGLGMLIVHLEESPYQVDKEFQARMVRLRADLDAQREED